MAFSTTTTRRFIKEHGEICTVRQRTTGFYDDLTGTVPLTYVDYKAYGYSSTTVPSLLTNNSVVKNARHILLTNYQTNGNALPLPKVNDQILFGGYTLDVVEVDVVKSNGSVVYYTVKVEG